MCTEKELGLMFTQEATFLTMMSTEVQGRLTLMVSRLYSSL